MQYESKLLTCSFDNNAQLYSVDVTLQVEGTNSRKEYPKLFMITVEDESLYILQYTKMSQSGQGSVSRQ